MSIAEISESLCIGCGICTNVCPFNAIEIVNIPSLILDQVFHRYGKNSFLLCKLPIPRKSRILGIIGPNGVGKTTAIDILTGNLQPNFGGRVVKNPWRGYEILQDIMPRYQCLNKPKCIIKNQHLTRDGLFGRCGKVSDLFDEYVRPEEYNLVNIWDKSITILSGGEKQRVAIAQAVNQDGNVYVFDEPSNFLDIEQRIKAGLLIRGVSRYDRLVTVIDHDLTVIDYVCDDIVSLYGKPSTYGVSSSRYPVAEGVNAYVSGYLPRENIRIRKEKIRYVKSDIESGLSNNSCVSWEEKRLNFENDTSSFILKIKADELKCGELCVVVGKNGIGKSQFSKFLSSNNRVSWKCQDPLDNFRAWDENWRGKKVEEYLQFEIDGVLSSQIIEILGIKNLYSKKIGNLRGGECQKIVIVVALCRDATLYLIDEPSAFLDIETRLLLVKAFKVWRRHRQNSCMLLIDHDLMLTTGVADRVLFIQGNPGQYGEITEIQDREPGFNHFMKDLGVTWRQDVHSARPRINSPNSCRDIEQKKRGNYFVF